MGVGTLTRVSAVWCDGGRSDTRGLRSRGRVQHAATIAPERIPIGGSGLAYMGCYGGVVCAATISARVSEGICEGGVRGVAPTVSWSRNIIRGQALGSRGRPLQP